MWGLLGLWGSGSDLTKHGSACHFLPRGVRYPAKPTKLTCYSGGIEDFCGVDELRRVSGDPTNLDFDLTLSPHNPTNVQPDYSTLDRHPRLHTACPQAACQEVGQ